MLLHSKIHCISTYIPYIPPKTTTQYPQIYLTRLNITISQCNSQQKSLYNPYYILYLKNQAEDPEMQLRFTEGVSISCIAII